MIYLGADHRGFELKEKIKSWLSEWGYDYEDLGAEEYDKNDDYPDFGRAVALKVTTKHGSRGILVCGSGIGIAIAANKIKGIRSGTISLPAQAAASVHDEDLNILSLASDFIGDEESKAIVRIFLEAKFHGEARHLRRMNKIEELEK